MNLGPALQNRGSGSTERLVFDPRLMLLDTKYYSGRTAHGQWLRKRIRLAERFNAEAGKLCEDVGFSDALALRDRADSKIRAIGRKIFDVEPHSVADFRIHARGISAIDDEGIDGGWVFVGMPARKLVQSLLYWDVK